MDRNREARRGVAMAASNGLSRRRYRSNSLRDSPEDGILELQETARLRNRKKDRDRDRDRDRERERDRDRERDRERERDRLSRNSKRRRSDKFMHGSMREEGADDTSDESVNDDEDDDDDDGGGGGNSSSVRMLPPNPSTSSSSILNHHNSNHHHHHHHHHHNSNTHNSHSNNNNNNFSRRSFPPPVKVFRATPPSVTSTTTTTNTSSTWKAGDEMIGVSVPRKARSASTKRSHEWASSGGAGGVVCGAVVGGEQIHPQSSTSPVRPSVPTETAIPAPASPSNVSVRKKMKPSGPKVRPPKSSSNRSSSSAQDEIEIEIAEVLYGMMRQPQGPLKHETAVSDSVSREININNVKSSSDAKSRVSSPISNSPSTLPQSSSILPTNSSSSTAPVSAIAPKRKRPRPVKYDDENPSMFKVRNNPISATTKSEVDQSAKTEPLPKLEKNSATAATENGSISYDLGSSQASEPQLESKKPENNALLADSKVLTEESENGRGDLCAAKEEPQSPKKESVAGIRLDDDRRDNMALTKANSTPSEVEIEREEKFQIDLMAPPLRSSPERDGEIDFVAVDLQPGPQKPEAREDEKEVETVKYDTSVEAEEKKAKTVVEESETQKSDAVKERNIDLHHDLEKSDRDSGNGSGSVAGNKGGQQQQQQQQVPQKTVQSNSLPLPLSMASWPGGLPPMGYMAPLQGVVSMDGTAAPSAAIKSPHLLLSQSRPKRCETHCYIARNIHYHQQFTKMNPFWPAAAGSASLYGAKATCNLNVVPPTELHGTFPGRGVNTVSDKGQSVSVATFPSQAGKDSKSSQPATIMDAAQRKQVLLQQAPPPGAPSNILHAPAFIFPLSQQQGPAAAAIRPGSVKSPPSANAASSSASNSATVSASATPGSTALSFSYPNMPGNEAQYFAILQNNGYPFPISPHVGAQPTYRGTHAQAMPFFNGSFYSSQMLHPSQQQQQQPLSTQSLQSQQGHQNTSISNGSSSSQKLKHLQNHQQWPHSSGISGTHGTMQGFPTPKNQVPLQLLQQQNQQVPHQSRQLESEMGGKESQSTADSRVSRANMNIYGQNFAMPLHPPNFALMATVPTSTSEKKPQQQSSKAEVESLIPQTFAMTFASINGAPTAPGFDISSIAQNPALLQSLPEAVRHGYQIMAAAQSAQQKNNYRVSEEGKTGGNDASNLEEERKSNGKPPATVGQSIAFSRQDLTDAQVSAITGNTVLDSSTRAPNHGSVSARTNVSVMPASMSNVNASAAQQQLQRSQQQHQQMMQLQKQQQFAAAAAAAQRSKTPATSNGSVYSDHLPASNMAAKFPNDLSVFPQNLVQSSSSQAQSPQWKNSGRTSTSQVNSQSLASSTTSSPKNLPLQQGRSQQGHTQISFAANPKSSSAQGQPPASNSQSASPPMMVGSPTTSSVSKTSVGVSPRTTATTTSAANKGGQISLSSQQAKNSPSMPIRKSSPVPSILGNPNIFSSSSPGAKQQMSQHQQQQQLAKHAFQQAQLLFSNAAYMQPSQAPHAAAITTSSASAASGFFIQRHREQQQQPGSSATSSSGMLLLCPPVTHSNSGTSDPVKAVAAASNMKGLSSQGLVHTGQFATTQSSGKQIQHVPPGFPYVHAVPTPVQVKPSEQKQPAGE